MNNFEDLIKQDDNLLIKLDAMEEQIQLADKISKEYEGIKKQIKAQMLEFGKENNLEQIKWVTPKGIKITLSVGKPGVAEIQEEKMFSEELLREKYPQIYEECCIIKQREVTIQAPSYDRLVVTMPKKEG